MRKIVFAMVFIIVCILNICMIVLLPIKATQAGATKTYGYIQIKVLEANSLKPVPNATVCIIENSHYATTDKNGQTQKIQVPVLRNTSYDNILLKNWGEFTLLIYKPGFCTLLNFYNEVYAGVTRIGLVCYLVPQSTNNQITTNANIPNSAYLETLIVNYKK